MNTYICFQGYSHFYGRNNNLPSYNGNEKHRVVNKTLDEVIDYCKEKGYKCFVRGGRDGSRYYIKTETDYSNLLLQRNKYMWKVKTQKEIKRHKNCCTYFLFY